jgi:toxin ParE1/3/4
VGEPGLPAPNERLNNRHLADEAPPFAAGRFRPRRHLVLRCSQSGSIDIADRLIGSITDRFLLLASYPNIGRARDEDLRPGLRTFPVGEYIILYRIDDEDVVILRVLRASRNIAALFGH